MKKITLLVLFFVITSLTYAQSIKGKVLDAHNKKPLQNVHVYFNTKYGSFTNEKGKFLLKSSYKPTDIIHFSSIGYKPLKIMVSDFVKSNYKIFLTADEESLNEVFVFGKSKPNNHLTYKKLPSLPKPLTAFGSTMLNNKIYVFGGDYSNRNNPGLKAFNDKFYDFEVDPRSTMRRFLDDVNFNSLDNFQKFSPKTYMYDFSKDVWTDEEFKIRNRAYHNAINYNGKIFLIGGKYLSTNNSREYLDNTLEVIDLNNKSVLLDKVNPHQAVNFSSFLYKDNIIVLGGSIKKTKSGMKQFAEKIHMFNVDKGLWYEVGTMPVPKETSAILVHDKIYLFGGYDNKELNTIESFNLKTSEWKNEGVLFENVKKPSLAQKGSIIFIYYKGKIATYNTKSKTLKEYAIKLDYQDPTLFLKDNKLYLLGGVKNESYESKPTANFISIDLDEFKRTKVKREVIFSAISQVTRQY